MAPRAGLEGGRGTVPTSIVPQNHSYTPFPLTTNPNHNHHHNHNRRRCCRPGGAAAPCRRACCCCCCYYNHCRCRCCYYYDDYHHYYYCRYCRYWALTSPGGAEAPCRRACRRSRGTPLHQARYIRHAMSARYIGTLHARSTSVRMKISMARSIGTTISGHRAHQHADEAEVTSGESQ